MNLSVNQASILNATLSKRNFKITHQIPYETPLIIQEAPQRLNIQTYINYPQSNLPFNIPAALKDPIGIRNLILNESFLRKPAENGSYATLTFTPGPYSGLAHFLNFQLIDGYQFMQSPHLLPIEALTKQLALTSHQIAFLEQYSTQELLDRNIDPVIYNGSNPFHIPFGPLAVYRKRTGASQLPLHFVSGIFDGNSNQIGADAFQNLERQILENPNWQNDPTLSELHNAWSFLYRCPASMSGLTTALWTEIEKQVENSSQEPSSHYSDLEIRVNPRNIEIRFKPGIEMSTLLSDEFTAYFYRAITQAMEEISNRFTQSFFIGFDRDTVTELMRQGNINQLLQILSTNNHEQAQTLLQDNGLGELNQGARDWIHNRNCFINKFGTQIIKQGSIPIDALSFLKLNEVIRQTLTGSASLISKLEGDMWQTIMRVSINCLAEACNSGFVETTIGRLIQKSKNTDQSDKHTVNYLQIAKQMMEFIMQNEEDIQVTETGQMLSQLSI